MNSDTHSHIGFDAKRAFLNRTGLGNYAQSVIKMLVEQRPEHDYYLYTPRADQHDPYVHCLSNRQNIRIRTAPNTLCSFYWRSKGVLKDLKKDGIQLYHGLSQELPIGIEQTAIRSIVTIHDLIAVHYPQYFSWIDQKIYQIKMRHACAVADHIIAISKRTKADIIQHFGIHPDKVTIIYQSCDAMFKQKQSDETKANIKKYYTLPDRFLLHVGTVEMRKNLPLIIKALTQVPETMHLVIAGRKTAYVKKLTKLIKEAGLLARVHFLSEVSHKDLPAIYQQAELFIYPSKYEGFGIPILEALYSGVPVIAAKGSCLEEAGGPYSAYVDPNESQELADRINVILNDPSLQVRMRLKGWAYSMKFEAETLAKQLFTVYDRVLRHHAR